MLFAMVFNASFQLLIWGFSLLIVKGVQETAGINGNAPNNDKLKIFFIILSYGNKYISVILILSKPFVRFPCCGLICCVSHIEEGSVVVISFTWIFSMVE